MFLLTRSKDDRGFNVSRNPESLGQTLYKTCSQRVEQLIHNACRNIQRIYGNYDEERCRQKVDELQKYILANLPAVVIDDLGEIREVRVTHLEEDIRIALAVYMHSNMRKFFIQRFIKIPTRGLDLTFLAMQFPKLQNLVVLDLNFSCTDEILEIVTDKCRKLAYIGIVSKVEPIHFKDWKHLGFNALKLQDRVSDVGLGYLCKCKLLRKIKMKSTFRSRFGGGLVTLGGIRRLVKSLPLLQHITFQDMGLVLAEEMEDVRHLSLTCLSDFHPQPAHLEIVSRLCPNLKQLSLRCPTTENTVHEADILHALMSSSLKVCELQLLGFSLSSEFSFLMQAKGCYLKSLAIENICCITMETIQLIGRTCPNLIILHLAEEQFPGQMFSWINSQYLDMCPAGGIFGNLQCLTLIGRSWIPNDILPLCLGSAKELKELKIYNTNEEGSLDVAISRIISTNSLQELTTIYLWTQSKLSGGIIEYFFRNCPRLMVFLFRTNPHLTNDDVTRLCAKMQQQNITFSVNYLQ